MSNPNLFPASGNVIWSQKKNARIHFQILVSSPPPIYDTLGIITFYHLTTLHINVTQVCYLGGRINDPKAHLQLSYCSKGICHYMCFPWIVLLHISQFSHLVMCDSATPQTAAHQASLSFTNFQCLLKLLSIELMMPSNHLIFSHPFFSCPQSLPTSGPFPMS